MKKALAVLVAAATLATAPAPGRADVVRLDSSERDHLLPLTDRLVRDISDVRRTLGTGRPLAVRNRALQSDAADLEDDAIALRNAVRRGRPVDLEREIEELRDGLTALESRIEPRGSADAALREPVRTALATVDDIEQQAARVEGVGKADARSSGLRDEDERGRATIAGRETSDALLGLAHDLQVRMSRVQELARGQGGEADALTTLGDEAYAFHHALHDGRLSYSESGDRVLNIARAYRRADEEMVRRRVSPELRAEWQAIGTIVEKMESQTGL
jgi:hypothetical protein